MDTRDLGNKVRIAGRVKVTFPDRGYFWILGDDGVKYYGHAMRVRRGYPVIDMWEGQQCTFVAMDDRRGPAAVDIEMAE